MDWSELYPHFFPGNPSEEKTQQVEFADIGCGYGGLLGELTSSFWLDVFLLFIFWSLYSCLPLCLYLCPVELSPLFPDKLMLGLEIRVKVSDYVRDRIQSLRASEPERYQNIACIRSNAMKYLPNFFCKGQVQQCLVASTGAIHHSAVMGVIVTSLTTDLTFVPIENICFVHAADSASDKWSPVALAWPMLLKQHKSLYFTALKLHSWANIHVHFPPIWKDQPFRCLLYSNNTAVT